MADAALVSVIVPVWNGARHLRESLDSILDQTYSPIEVIVMDDASTDETPAIVASYGSAVRLFRQERNRGIYDNVNDGLALARGELVAVYHADDVYAPSIVEREAGFLRLHPAADAVFCLDIWIDAEGIEYGRLELPPDVPGDRPLDFPTVWNALLQNKNTFLVCPTSMVRARVYRELGGYRQSLFGDSADLDMWIRVAKKGAIGILNEHLMSYRHFHGGSLDRYHHLRTDPDLFFAIMNHHMVDGASEVSKPAALLGYEAHRCEDRLMIAASHYIQGETGRARAVLREIRASTMARSSRIQRWRLLLLLAVLRVLCRLPRSRLVADAFYRRWHARKGPGERAHAASVEAVSVDR